MTNNTSNRNDSDRSAGDQSTEPLWDPCPPGTLSGEGVKRVRQRRIRRGLGLAVVLIAVATPLIPSPEDASDVRPALNSVTANTDQENSDSFEVNNGEPNYGGIVCSRVRQQVADYRSGKLDPQTRSKMETHVKQCVLCSDLLALRTESSSIMHLIAINHSMAGWRESF